MAQRWIKSSRNLCSVLDTLGHAAGSREKAWAIHDFTPQTGQFEVAVMKGNADEVPEFKLLKAEGSGCDKPKDKKPAEKDNKPVEKPAECSCLPRPE